MTNKIDEWLVKLTKKRRTKHVKLETIMGNES